MKKYLLFTALVFGFFACGDDERDLDITFLLNFDGEPFVFFTDYSYPGTDDLSFRITNIKSYISDVQLTGLQEDTDANGTELLSEAEFLDIGTSHLNMEDAEKGYTISFNDISTKEIQSLRFNTGLTEEQNMTVPSDYTAGTPLSLTGEYWPSWNSYIMTKVEGFYDSDGDGEPDAGFALHLGTTACTKMVSLSNIVDDNDEIFLSLNVADIFRTENEFYDLIQTPNIHMIEQMDQAVFLANNFATAIQFEE